MNLRFDPRTKLYLLFLANLLLFFHVNLVTEGIITALFLLPFFLAGKKKKGLRLLILYLFLLSVDFFVIPVSSGFWLNLISMFSVGFRMIFPCIITGAYAFSTTTVGELVCALRRMHVPESVIIPITVVIRFFPTVREDYRQIKDAMALRQIAAGNAALLRRPAQSLEYILIPLLMNANNVSQDLSVAALTKGIGLEGKHTSMTEIKLTGLDWCYMIISTIPVLLYLCGII